MCLAGATHLRSKRDIRSVKLAVRPPGHAEGSPRAWEARERHKTSAAHRSAAMAGGARPDPFRTRKLSRRAPMVLRGQPVGEQGAADRWTALDPYVAGSGAGAPRGTPPRRPLSLSLHIVQPRAPWGPFFMPRGPAIERRIPWPPVCGPGGAIHIGSGAGRRLPRGAPPFPRGRSRRRGGARPAGSRGAVPPDPGACGRAPLRTVCPFTGAAPRGPPRQVAVPLGAGGLAGIPREPLCRPPAAPAGQGIGARPAGTVRGRRFSCREPGRPPCPPPPV